MTETKAQCPNCKLIRQQEAEHISKLSTTCTRLTNDVDLLRKELWEKKSLEYHQNTEISKLKAALEQARGPRPNKLFSIVHFAAAFLKELFSGKEA